MRVVSLTELVDWIVVNRKGEAFKDYPHNKIASLIQHSEKQKCLSIMLNSKDNICGVCCGCKSVSNKIFMVYDILTTEIGTVKRMMKQFISIYPDYRIVGECRNRFRKFIDPSKLERRLKP